MATEPRMGGVTQYRSSLSRVLGAALVAAGCGTPRDFEVKDNRVFFGDLRVTTAQPLGPIESTGPDAAPQSEPNRAFSIELDLSAGSGDGTQDLDSGDILSYDGTIFSGPEDVDGDFDLFAGSIAGRMDVPVSGRTRVGFLVGLGFTSLDLELSQSGTKQRDTTSSLGIMMGLIGETRLSARTEAYGRFTAMLGGSDESDNYGMNFNQLEAGVRWNVAHAISLFGGARYWGYHQDRAGADIDIEMSGPMLGIQIEL